MNYLKPLFVDLDGTLIKEDLSRTAFWHFFQKKPFKCIYHVIIFFFLGRPYLKKKISEDFKVELKNFKLNLNCIKFINLAKNNNRKIYLISGSHQILLNQIKNQLNLFEKVYGTHENFNMVGKNKVLFINNKLKIYNFDYIGNSHQDLPIWINVKNVIYTNINSNLKKKILKLNLKTIEIKEKFNFNS